MLISANNDKILGGKEARGFCVELNGIDISNDATVADDERGWVLCYKRNREGRIERNVFGYVALELREGVVRIFLKGAGLGTTGGKGGVR